VKLKLIATLREASWWERLRWIADRGVALAALVFLGILLWQHGRMIVSPYLLEYREGSVLTMGQYILQGENPFTLETMPENTYVYGFLFPYVGAPLAWATGDLLLGYRLTSGLFIFLNSVILFLVLRRERLGPGLSVALAVVFHAFQLQWLIYTARCDSLGLFLFLTAIWLPYGRGWGKRSVALSAALCLAAFYTKPYFLYALAVVGAYLFLFVSKKKALWFAGCLAVFGAASAVVFHLLFPTFFFSNIFLHTNYAISNFGHLRWQMEVFLEKQWPFLALLAVASLVWMYWRLRRRRVWTMRLFQHWDRPAFAPPMNYHVFCLAMGAAVIVTVLGKHGGNFMIYLYQFMLPFLLVAAVTVKLPFRPRVGPFLYPLLALAGLYLGWRTVNESFLGEPVRMSDDGRLVRQLADASDVYATPVFVPQLLRADRKVWDNGLTQYFERHDYPDFLASILPAPDRIDERWRQYREELDRKVEEREFDLIVLNNNFGDVIDRKKVEVGYGLEERMLYRIPGQEIELEIWRPLSNEGVRDPGTQIEP